MQIALYRKYRPTDLKDLVGQDHVAKTLENSLKGGHFSHAYLFSGPRGVGKTSTARILANRINKLKASEANNHMDIIEIDAASNRGIDDIRSLREKIHTAPASREYKVYIIDEVHMLTGDAFGGLLKTLEEPPSHVIFVLATTEPHKLPETIISRTQRFNFRPVPNNLLQSYLLKIAGAEHIKVEDDAAELIATSSEGSVRDALSMLDQAASVGDKPITAAAVAHMLGLVDVGYVNKMLIALLTGNQVSLVTQLGAYSAQGGTATQLLRQLMNALHKLLQARIGSSNTVNSDLLAVGKDASIQKIVKLINVLAQLPANSAHLDIALEATLIELCLAQNSEHPASTRAAASAPAKQKSQPRPVSNVPASHTKSADTDSADSNWAKVLTTIKQQNNSLYALLRSATASVAKNTVTVQFRFQFHLRRLEETRNRQLLETSLKDIYGQQTQLETILIKSAASGSTDETKENQHAVDSVIQILGGEVMGG